MRQKRAKASYENRDFSARSDNFGEVGIQHFDFMANNLNISAIKSSCSWGRSRAPGILPYYDGLVKVLRRMSLELYL